MSKNDISCQIAYFKEKIAFSQLKTELQKSSVFKLPRASTMLRRGRDSNP